VGHDISSFASAGGIKISSVFCAPLATRTPANPTRLRGSKVFELDDGPTTGMSHLTKPDRYGFTTGTRRAFVGSRFVIHICGWFNSIEKHYRTSGNAACPTACII
jgi:hypothetical protein